MKKNLIVIFAVLFFSSAFCQDTIKFKNQYEAKAKNIVVNFNGKEFPADSKGEVILFLNPGDSFSVNGSNYDNRYFTRVNLNKNKSIVLHKKFTWSDLLTPMFYIIFGGIWFILFIIFAETGLFAGFFLPGDSLLFVTGIFSTVLVEKGLGIHNAGSLINLLILGILISASGVLGNYVGYWFGQKSGPFLFERKDTFFFKKKYLLQAKDFFEKHGGSALIMARFLPIVRTFAPIVAGIVGMKKKKFAYFNVVGCIAWVFTMLFAGHYLQQFILHQYHFDLKEHLEVIVLGIVAVTTLPVILKLIFGKIKSRPSAETQKSIERKHNSNAPVNMEDSDTDIPNGISSSTGFKSNDQPLS